MKNKGFIVRELSEDQIAALHDYARSMMLFFILAIAALIVCMVLVLSNHWGEALLADAIADVAFICSAFLRTKAIQAVSNE